MALITTPRCVCPVRKLTTLLDEGIERRRGKLLNSTLVINLYTLMYKACSQSEENIPKLYEYFGKAVSRSVAFAVTLERLMRNDMSLLTL